MSILVLNSVPHRRSPYEKFLKELNEDLILLTAEKHREGFPEKDYVYIESFENYDDNGFVDLRAIELYKKYQYRTIINCYEFDVLRAATIREALRLPGQWTRSAMMYRNKHVMKKMVQQHGIPIPSFRKIITPIDLIEFIERHNYPVLIKPIQGAGSRKISTLNNPHDLRQFLRQGIPPDTMVESFVEGDIYHVDGIINNGKIEFVCTSKYLRPLYQYQSGTYTGGYLLHPTNPLSIRMEKLTAQVVQALDTPANTTFHAEWFHTPDDRIIFCEIASRPGGGRINETLKHTFGVDLYQSHVRLLLDLPQQLPKPEEISQVNKLSGRVLMIKKEGRFLSAPKEDPPPWVVHYELAAKPGDLIGSPTDCVDFIAGFVVEGSSEDEVQQRLYSISNWFYQLSQWE